MHRRAATKAPLFRAEFAEALRSGKLPAEIAQRFLDMNANPLLAWLMKIP